MRATHRLARTLATLVLGCALIANLPDATHAQPQLDDIGGASSPSPGTLKIDDPMARPTGLDDTFNKAKLLPRNTIPAASQPRRDRWIEAMEKWRRDDPRYAHCNAAAQAIIDARTTITASGKPLWKPDLAIPEDKQPADFKAFVSYTTYCFVTPRQAKKTGIAPGRAWHATNLVDEDALNDALNRYVILKIGAKRCGGFVLGDEILTARHCLTGKETENCDQGSKVCIPPNTSFQQVAPLSGSSPCPQRGFGTQVPIAPRPLARDEFDSRAKELWFGDWLKFRWRDGSNKDCVLKRKVRHNGDDRIESIASFTPYAARLANPEHWQRIVVVSWNTYGEKLRTYHQRFPEQEVPPHWFRDDSVRLDTNPNCVIQDSLFGVQFHACQADAGTSGSPVFALLDTGLLQLVGVTTRDSQGVISTCKQRLLKGLDGKVIDRTNGGLPCATLDADAYPNAAMSWAGIQHPPIPLPGLNKDIGSGTGTVKIPPIKM